jgi:hypothetical protein
MTSWNFVEIPGLPYNQPKSMPSKNIYQQTNPLSDLDLPGLLTKKISKNLDQIKAP